MAHTLTLAFAPPKHANPLRCGFPEFRSSLLILNQRSEAASPKWGPEQDEDAHHGSKRRQLRLQHSRIDGLVFLPFPLTEDRLQIASAGCFHRAHSEADFLDYTSAKFSIFKTPGIHSISSTLISFRCKLMGMRNMAIARTLTVRCQETLPVCPTLSLSGLLGSAGFS